MGLAAHQPLESNFFPGILEGLMGRLGLAPPGVMNPPTSVRAGMSRHWAATLREAVRMTEGGEIDLRQVESTVVPHRLHLDYDLDFCTWRVDDVAPTLTSPLLFGLIGNIHQLDRPAIPQEPASFKADENLWDTGRVLPKLDVSSPSHDDEVAPKRRESKGKPRKMSLLAKEKVLRINILRSLTSQTYLRSSSQREMKVTPSLRGLRVPLHQEVSQSEAESNS